MAESREQGLGRVVQEPIDKDEGMKILDRAAHKQLGMSGDEFLDRWNDGDYDDLDHVAVMEVAMLIPLAR